MTPFDYRRGRRKHHDRSFRGWITAASRWFAIEWKGQLLQTQREKKPDQPSRWVSTTSDQKTEQHLSNAKTFTESPILGYDNEYVFNAQARKQRKTCIISQSVGVPPKRGKTVWKILFRTLKQNLFHTWPTKITRFKDVMDISLSYEYKLGTGFAWESCAVLKLCALSYSILKLVATVMFVLSVRR